MTSDNSPKPTIILILPKNVEPCQYGRYVIHVAKHRISP